MARLVAVLLVVTSACCMEMHETVERMVMVRKTGSDLQPEASGFIYKKDDSGPASVIKMEETEVMEHLSKLYEQPKAFAAPIPIAAGPFYVKEDDGKTALTSSKVKVIPVVEVSQDNDEQLDGIANEDYGKILEETPSDYKSDFDDYLKKIKYFQDGIYQKQTENVGTDERKEQNKSDEKEGSNHSFEKGGAGDYHTSKYESYQISEKGSDENKSSDADSYEKYNGDGHKGNDAVRKKDEFHRHYDKDEYKKEHDSFSRDEVKDGFDKYTDGHSQYGSEPGKLEAGDNFKSRLYEDGFGEGFYDDQSRDEHGTFDEDEPSPEHHQGDFGSKVYGRKFYGYQIKH